MKPTTPIIILFVVLLAALLWLGLLAQRADAPENLNLEQDTEIQDESPKIEENQNINTEANFGTDAGMELPIPDEENPVVLENEPVVFLLDAKNFAFEMDGATGPELRVSKGDTVSVTLTSTEGFHDFVIDELGVASAKISLGQSTTVTFTATESGEYEYYCSVGSHRAQGMFGKLIVE